MVSILRTVIACLLLSSPLRAQPTMVVVQKGDDSLGVYDVESGRPLARVAVGTKPDERTAYVANSGSGTVSVVWLGLGRETKTIAIGGVPMGLALSADGRRLFAANRIGDAVAGINTGTAEVVGRVAIPGNPARVRLSPDGRHLLASLIEAGDVAVVDAGTLRVVHRFHAGRHAEGLTIDPAGRFGYVSAGDDDSVVRFTLGDWKPVRAIPTARKPDPIVLIDPGR